MMHSHDAEKAERQVWSYASLIDSQNWHMNRPSFQASINRDKPQSLLQIATESVADRFAHHHAFTIHFSRYSCRNMAGIVKAETHAIRLFV